MSTEVGADSTRLKAKCARTSRTRLAFDLCSIDEVARSLGMTLEVVIHTACRCRGWIEIQPRLGLFRCFKCGKVGDALDLVQLMKRATPTQSARYLEELACRPLSRAGTRGRP